MPKKRCTTPHAEGGVTALTNFSNHSDLTGIQNTTTTVSSQSADKSFSLRSERHGTLFHDPLSADLYMVSSTPKEQSKIAYGTVRLH